MKTTTNRNERRPAAPRPAAKVLRYEVPVYRLTLPHRANLYYVDPHAPPPRTLYILYTLLPSPLSLFHLYTVCLHSPSRIHTAIGAPHDYVSLLDNTPESVVGKTNATSQTTFTVSPPIH